MNTVLKFLPIWLAFAIHGLAFGFDFELGELTGSLITKVTVGATIRTQSNDPDYIGVLNNPGQQAYCDNGQPIDVAVPGIGAAPSSDPLGSCVLAGFPRFVNAKGSFVGHALDDGKLNYDKNDVVAAAAKVVTDFSVRYENLRFVSQIIAVADPVNTGFEEQHPNSFFTCAEDLDNDPGTSAANGACGAQPSRTARKKAAEDTFNQIDLTTAFVELQTEAFEQVQVFRLGKQNIRWGESLAIPVNSINSINPPDTVRLRTPGFSLDELFDPSNALLFNTGLSDTLLFEAIYLLDWDPVRINAPGTFFSPNDVAGIGNGRSTATLGLGFSREDPSNLLDRVRGDSIDISQFGRDCFFDRDGNINPDGQHGALNQGAHRGAMVLSEDSQGRPGLRPADSEGILDYTSGRQGCLVSTMEPDQYGQWGMKLNWVAEELNTEFGFYYLNYHSRLPYFSVYSGQLPSDNLDLPPVVSDTLGVAGIPVEAVASIINALKVSDTLRTAFEYPEDIEMFGVSASTNIGDYSVAAEYSYRPDLPLQVFPSDVLFYGQAPAFGRLRCNSVPSLLDQYRNGDYTEYSNNSNCPEVSNAAGEFIHGYERLPVGQGEVVVISLAETNPFLADTWARILDLGFTKVFGMPDTTQLAFSGGHAESLPIPGRRELDDDGNGNFDGLRSDGGFYGGDGNGDGTLSDPDNLATAVILNPQQEDAKAFASSFSWGYRFINILTYEQVLAGTLEMTFAFFHDVNGTTPGPATNFIEDRKTIVWANSFKKGAYAFGARYTWQTGAGNRNYLRDTDTFGMSVGYTS